MTKEQILDTIKLLSALEAWGFAEKHRLPDYLSDDLDKIVKILSMEFMHEPVKHESLNTERLSNW